MSKMGQPVIDITGQVFGKLTVLSRAKCPNNSPHMTYWLCQCECGNRKVICKGNLVRGKRGGSHKPVRSCGCLARRRGKDSPNYKGGYINNGYRIIPRPIKYKRHKSDDSIHEHVYVMSEHLGRQLNKNEVVHHIDGNRLNNNIENLELRTRNTHPPGQSIDDMINTSLEYISRYADKKRIDRWYKRYCKLHRRNNVSSKLAG